MPSFHSIRHFGLSILTAFALAANPAGAQLAKTTGALAGGSGAGTVAQPPDLAPPVNAKPEPPLSSVIGPKTSTTMTLIWTDGSAIEDGYRIERQDGTLWTLIKSFGAIGVGNPIGVSTTYKVTGLTHNTRYCFRIVAFNGLGSTYGPALCATTPRVILPITVVVSDLQGLQGELEDLTPLGPLVASDPTAPATAPPTTPRKIVYVSDSAVIRIPPGSLFRLQQGVHLMSGRRGLTQGALLYADVATSSEVKEHSVIEVVGDDVRISGLRLRGPSAGTDENLERAVGIYLHDVRDVVIDHNEFSQWTESGVKVQHGPGLLGFLTADRVRITENYFHHNQRRNLGYGVVIKDASYAYIDKNTFDWNRHAIASDGGRNVIPDPSYGPRQGYRAYLNVVLPGHTEIEYVAGLVGNQTHHFDVHGTESNWLGVDYYDGWAGEYFDVADNSFLGILGTAFNIRGTPSSQARFHHNVTPLGDDGFDGGNSHYGAASYYDGGWAAVKEESDRDNIEIFGNIPSVDPRGRLGVGDFDGDGRDDVFLATGRAWYVSYGGVTEWRFLNASDRTLISSSLVDLDGNGRTDVVIKTGTFWRVAWNGVGNFVPLQTTLVLPSQDFYANGELIGDFSGDGVLDRLSFDPNGDRYFRAVNGANGATTVSRHQM